MHSIIEKIATYNTELLILLLNEIYPCITSIDMHVQCCLLHLKITQGARICVGALSPTAGDATTAGATDGKTVVVGEPPA